ACGGAQLLAMLVILGLSRRGSDSRYVSVFTWLLPPPSPTLFPYTTIFRSDDNAELVTPGEENVGTLAPTESRTITVTHTVTQDRSNEHTAENQSRENGIRPHVPANPEVPSHNPDTPDPADPTDTDVEQTQE